MGCVERVAGDEDLNDNRDNKDNKGGCRQNEAYVALRLLSMLSVLP